MKMEQPNFVNTSRANNGSKLLVISCDGFRYDFLKKIESPHFDKLMKNGTTFQFGAKSIFPTKTYPNYHTMSVGRYPEVHGIVDNEVYDEKLGKLLKWTDEDLYSYNENILPIWILNEKSGNGRKSGVISWPGSWYPYGLEKDFPSKIVHYNEQRPYTWKMDTAISWLTENEKPCNLVMLYIEEPDLIGHKFGPESKEMVEMIKKLDDVIGYLNERLEEFPALKSNLNIIFVSDHGHQEIQPGPTVAYDKYLTNEDNVMFDTFGGGTTLHIKVKNESYIETIQKGLEKAKENLKGTFEFYKKSQIPERYHIAKAEGRMHDFLLVADPGFILPRSIEHKTVDKVCGDHGYDNESPLMRSLFFATGPNIRKGYNISKLVENAILFELICKLLKIEMPKIDFDSKGIIEDFVRY